LTKRREFWIIYGKPNIPNYLGKKIAIRKKAYEDISDSHLIFLKYEGLTIIWIN